MMRLDKSVVGVDQGDVVLFSDYENGGKMWTGKGSRERRHAVKFSEPYRVPPAIQCSLSMWDMDSATNARADVQAEKITETGFEIVFRTWEDTRVARARVRWIAIGELDHEDNWQLY